MVLNRREIIEKILTLRPDLAANELQQLIQEKRENAGNLLTEEGATYMVANELGLDLSNGRVVATDMKIKDLVLGANDATIVGCVVAVSPINSFNRRDGSEGYVARLVLADDTGTVAVVLWDDKTNILSQKGVAQNQVLRVAHGYVRAGLGGSPELNVGRQGAVTIQSSVPDVRTKTRMSKLKKIGDLKIGDSFVNFVGVVKGFSQISTFTRANGQQGQVIRLRLVDETGGLRVVFWDEQVNLVKSYRKDDVLKVQGGQARSGLGGVLEVHVGKFGSVNLVEDPSLLRQVPSKLTKIRNLKNGSSEVNVLGRVLSIRQTREFQRPSGRMGRVGSLYIMDETASIRVTLWDDASDLLNKISVDDVLLVEGSYTREGLGGSVELNVSSLGEISINPSMAKANTLPKSVTGKIKVSELKVGMQNVIVEGQLVEDPVIRNIMTRNGEAVRVASLRISDDTGEVDVSLWRDLVDKIDAIHKGMLIKIINCYVKPGFYGDLELSSGLITEVELLDTMTNSTDLQDLIDDLFTKEQVGKDEDNTFR